MSPTSFEAWSQLLPWLSSPAALTIIAASLIAASLTWGVMFLFMRRSLRIQAHDLTLQYEKYIALEQQKFSLQAEKQAELRESRDRGDTELGQLRERCAKLTADKTRYKEMLRQLPEYHKRVREQRHEILNFQARMEQKTEDLVRAQAQLEQMEALLVQLKEREARIESQQQELTSARESQREYQTRLEAINAAREQMTTQFQQLAQEILEEKSNKFVDQNRTTLDALISPLREQLNDFKRRVEDTYDKENRERVSLQSEINQLKGLNQRLSDEAQTLSTALRGDSKLQGNWGERVLNRVLESAGLQEGREFVTETVCHEQSDQGLRPDVIIHLPNKRDIVVDSKVSLAAYEQMVAANDEDERYSHMKAHLQSLRSHIHRLSGKKYADLKEVNSLDFVLMFVPVEAALHAAIQAEPSLFDEAYKKNIILVSATTLLTTCRTVQYLWRQEKQNQHAEEIAQRAGGLLDKFVGFVEDLENIGHRLDKAQEAYLSAHKRLSSGRGNLLKQAREVKALGVETKKELPSAEVTEILAKRSEVEVKKVSQNTA